jgi:protein-L-isoaspartate(D-aspartate) O-methyltransferase
MTGEAEARRKIKPDPANPQLANGSFEEAVLDAEGNKQPAGWHYQRQVTLKSDAQAPEGEIVAVFSNAEPGRGCHALQGFAVDGRKVSALQIMLWARGRDIQQGPAPNQLPAVVITFYDDRRAAVGEESTRTLDGTFPWQQLSAVLPVPLRTREAIVRVGLLGATGELSLDEVRMESLSSGEREKLQP